MKRHITIVGGGIVGLSCAYYLKQSGYDVRVIDKTVIGNSCAMGNAGYVSPSHFVPLSSPGMVAKGLRWMFNPESPFYIRPRWDKQLIAWLWQFNKHCTNKHVKNVEKTLLDLCFRSHQLYEQIWSDFKENFQFKRNGIYVLCNTDKALKEELNVKDEANLLGLKAMLVTPEELQSRLPDMQFNIKGGVLYPEDSHVHPLELMQSLHQYLLSQGVEFIENCSIDSVEISAQKVCQLANKDNEFEVDELVIASGSWSSLIGKQLNLNVPVQAGKGYSVTIEKPWRVDTPFILSEARVAITPFEKQIRFGGTMEFSGIDLSVNQRRIQGILKSVKKYITNFDIDGVDTTNAWAGLRPCSPDGLPLIGRPKRYSNVVLATGHAMLGLTLAPVTGKIVADLLSGKDEPTQNYLDPERFN
ncbi:NAD(P)/FAD-dependent oxidoreductase [Aliikangiella sp. IMCC44359]|uniref:NAD(P)/FAD-dependent oxidoreductase n=1 Tax=Aliikangiella sp. IMCC44359 TaxID=3459125 RepID=UPI00403A835C